MARPWGVLKAHGIIEKEGAFYKGKPLAKGCKNEGRQFDTVGKRLRFFNKVAGKLTFGRGFCRWMPRELNGSLS
jgi:hypothetical protein